MCLVFVVFLSCFCNMIFSFKNNVVVAFSGGSWVPALFLEAVNTNLMPKACCTLVQILKFHRVLEPGACWALWHPCILVSAWILMCLAVVPVASLVAFLRSLGRLWFGQCRALGHP